MQVEIFNQIYHSEMYKNYTKYRLGIVKSKEWQFVLIMLSFI